MRPTESNSNVIKKTNRQKARGHGKQLVKETKKQSAKEIQKLRDAKSPLQQPSYIAEQ